jgi:hypothetical protein
MIFEFTPAVKAALASGIYQQVYTKSGIPLSIARNAETGRFVANAVGLVVNNTPLAPIVAPMGLILNGLQMVQMQRGFQAIQASLGVLQTTLGVLQTTTAVIGVGTAIGVGLSAVNLWQIMKLKKAVANLDLKVENGFINLENLLTKESQEIKNLIKEVAEDIKFEQHRVILIKAYGLFIQALKSLRLAIKIEDKIARNIAIDNSRQLLFEALADYRNPQLLEETSPVGRLRRLECAWTIENAIVGTYQLQNELTATSEHLSILTDTIKQDSINIIEMCNLEEELDFIFPEIKRLHDHDLLLLNYWREQIDWMKTLPTDELKLLSSVEETEADTNINLIDDSKPPEQKLYEELQQKTHALALRDMLIIMMSDEKRSQYINFIQENASKRQFVSLNVDNLQDASEKAIANLYWYFNNSN